MNWLKDRFATKDRLDGIWLSSGSRVAAELAAAAGFDWALLDMEHGLGDLADTMRQIEVLTHTDCTPIVRLPAATSDLLQRLLDYGAAGVMAPMIDTADQAAALVRAVRYPPAGVRGLTRSSRASRYGHDFQAYFAQANDKLTTIVQIETAAAVRQAEQIAATEGVDVLFVGHSDLSLNVGCFERLDAPAMQAAEAAVLTACARHGKRAGMLLKAGMAAEPCHAKGFSMLALGSDIGCLKSGFERLRNTATPYAILPSKSGATG